MKKISFIAILTILNISLFAEQYTFSYNKNNQNFSVRATCSKVGVCNIFDAASGQIITSTDRDTFLAKKMHTKNGMFNALSRFFELEQKQKSGYTVFTFNYGKSEYPKSLEIAVECDTDLCNITDLNGEIIQMLNKKDFDRKNLSDRSAMLNYLKTLRY